MSRVLAILAFACVAHAAVAAPPEVSREDVTGRVVDRQDRPVAGAHVAVETMRGSKPLGEGVSGADGRFRLHLSGKPQGDLALTVTAPGFARWAYVIPDVAGDKSEKRVRLSREIDAAFLTALTAEKQPERRSALLLEILGERESGDVPLETVFPALGALHGDLRAFAQSSDASAGRARRLLAYWADPADASLVAGWIKDNPYLNAAPGEISDAELFGVCAKWTAEFFRKQGLADKAPWSSCQPMVGDPAVDPSTTRALLKLQVRYAHWGYSQLLVAARENGLWHLRVVAEDETFHTR